MKSIQHVLLVGDIAGQSSFHVGDEAMLECNLLLLRRLLPKAAFTLMSLDPEASRGLYATEGVPRLGFSHIFADRQSELQRIADWLDAAKHRPAELPEALCALMSAQLLVISGGGNLSSTWPEHIMERLALVRLAVQEDIPVLILGQTIGPNLAEIDAELVAEILRSASWVGLREASSVALALALEVPLARIDYQLDDAIELPPAFCPTPWPKAIGERHGPLIALTVHPAFALDADNGWLDCLAAELDQVIERTAAHILFISHVRSLRGDQDLGDRPVGEALAGRLRQPAAMTVLSVRSSAETVWLTQQADVVVSSRYHPLVFALAQSIPCLGLPTDHYTMVKIHGVLSHAQREADLLPISGSRWDGLAARVVALCQTGCVSLVQRAAWRTWLMNCCQSREARLAQLLDDLASRSKSTAVICTDTDALIQALARLANAPERFSLAAAGDTSSQPIIEHWQNTAQAAQSYILDLQAARQRDASEFDLLREELTRANHRAEVAERYARSLEQERVQSAEQSQGPD